MQDRSTMASLGPIAPPACNTGVRNTEEGKVIDSADYIGLTLPDDCPQEFIGDLFGVREWAALDVAGLGYKLCKQSGNIRWYSDGLPGMGNHFVLSGDACRELEADKIVTNWQVWNALALAYGAKVSRYDLARDDKAGILDLGELERCCDVGAVATKARKWHPAGDRAFGGGRLGYTLAIGSRQSETYLRLYDKALEQGVEGHWVRAELELKGDRAQAAFELVARQGLAVLPGLLARFVEFKARPGRDGENKARVPILPAWSTFLEAASKIKLAVQKKVRTVSSLVHYLEKQWAPSIATIMHAMGGDTAWFNEIAQAGDKRMRDVHYALLAPEPEPSRRDDFIERAAALLRGLDSALKAPEYPPHLT